VAVTAVALQLFGAFVWVLVIAAFDRKVRK
jgi:hypothetical protein